MLAELYVTKAPNEPVLLGRERINVKVGTAILEGDAEITLRWLPSPRVEVVADFEDGIQFVKAEAQHFESETFQFHFPTRGLTTEVQIRSKSLGRSARLTGSITDWGVPATVSECTRVEFHLANFPELFANLPVDGGPQRFKRILSFVGGPWEAELHPATILHNLIKELRESGGHAITYHGSFRRRDDGRFSRESARDVLDCLGEFFSFASGSRVPPLLARGVNDETVVWQELQVASIDQWRSRYVWLDEHHGEGLEELFPGFFDLWQNATWKRPLRSTIYWFTNANTAAAGVDTAIVLSQAALELLCWNRLVQELGSLSRDGFEKIPAADRLRLLLSACEIPLGIPSELRELQTLAKAFNWSDGPAAITALRNSIVHPDLDRRSKYSAALVEVWLLGQWYVELVVLRLAKYRGSYGSRLRTRWKGQVDPVPWALLPRDN